MTSAPVNTVFFDLGDTLITTSAASGPAWLPGASELLQQLQNFGVHLGVISNTGHFHREQLTPLLPANFDWSLFEPQLILLSAEVGHEKPEATIFKLALERAGANARCLFCSEDLRDTLVAQAVGMEAVRVAVPPHSDIASLGQQLVASGLIPEPAFGQSPADGTVPMSATRTNAPITSGSPKIVQLMSVPPVEHDLAWLKEALQAAAMLELSTIPPYLCAWWSIKDDSHEAADAIREIVVEEMLHLGLVCNLLTTIGEIPKLDDPASVPKYPGPLPGGVRPSVRVALSGLTKETLLHTFMEIEFPESGPIASLTGETFPTIGAFYNAIAAALGQLPDSAITNQHQLKSSSLGLFAITSPADAQRAIALIEHQGEGTSQSPFAVGSDGELAHFYRFAEIWHEHRLQAGSDGTFKFDGEALPFPETFPMEEVPVDGYPESHDFDTLYTGILHQLQSAWETGSQQLLRQAVMGMVGLTDAARTLMQMPLPSGMGTFGPSFKFISDVSPLAPSLTGKAPLVAKSIPSQRDDSSSTQDLSTAVQDLTKVAESLATSAQQIMQAMEMMVQHVPVDGGEEQNPTVAATSTINAWEDDPFSQKTPTATPGLATPIQVPVPNNTQSLKFKIVDPAVRADEYDPGTPQFRFWEATEAITRGIGFWNPLLPEGTVWSAFRSPLQVHLEFGEDFNANYSRQFGLRFYQDSVDGQQFFSAESPDVVCHELGHGILDAVRPELFNAASAETAAFHEAFGDMSAILSALQLPSLRQKVLDETGGKLNVNSRLSRLAEQLGWAIRQISPTAVDADSLRNAANRFFYADPDTLPPSAPSATLSSEAHSFSRVFSGAFLDALARMFKTAGSMDEEALEAISQDMGKLLIGGVGLAPVTSNYFSQVAASMLQVSEQLFGDRYQKALTTGFVQHGILSPTSASAAQTPTPPRTRGAKNKPLFAMGMASNSYLESGLSAPDLPTQTVQMMGLTFDVHAAEEQPRFEVASATFASTAMTTRGASVSDEAASYVEDLIQRGQLDLSTEPQEMKTFAVAATNMAERSVSRGNGTDREANQRTHVLVRDSKGSLVMKRLHFNCGCRLAR